MLVYEWARWVFQGYYVKGTIELGRCVGTRDNAIGSANLNAEFAAQDPNNRLMTDDHELVLSVRVRCFSIFDVFSTPSLQSFLKHCSANARHCSISRDASVDPFKNIVGRLKRSRVSRQRERNRQVKFGADFVAILTGSLEFELLHFLSDSP